MQIIETTLGLLTRLGADVFTAKMAVERSIAFSDDALHIVCGVFLQLGFAFVFRTSLMSWGPWLFVLVLELINEVNDLYMNAWANSWGESLKDLMLTMLLPTLLLLIARNQAALVDKARLETGFKPGYLLFRMLSSTEGCSGRAKAQPTMNSSAQTTFACCGSSFGTRIQHVSPTRSWWMAAMRMPWVEMSRIFTTARTLPLRNCTVASSGRRSARREILPCLLPLVLP